MGEKVSLEFPMFWKETSGDNRDMFVSIFVAVRLELLGAIHTLIFSGKTLI